MPKNPYGDVEPLKAGIDAHFLYYYIEKFSISQTNFKKPTSYQITRMQLE